MNGCDYCGYDTHYDAADGQSAASVLRWVAVDVSERNKTDPRRGYTQPEAAVAANRDERNDA
jgi:hypothetical protein